MRDREARCARGEVGGVQPSAVAGAMRITRSLSIVLLCGWRALASTPEEAIHEGLAAKLESDSLTAGDIPREWTSSVTASTNGPCVIRAHFRGTNKVMEVTWRQGWTGSQDKMFCALFMDGTNQLGRVMGFQGSTAFEDHASKPEYRVTFWVETNGEQTVSVCSRKSVAFVETYVIRGRQSCLEDDLEYTRNRVRLEGIATPLGKALGEQDAGKDKQPHAPRRAVRIPSAPRH